MFKAALAGLRSHALRFAATALAVIIGVAFVSGTYMFTDTINRTFEDLFSDAYEGVGVVVRAEDDFAEFNQSSQTLPESVVADIAAVEGVESVEGGVGGIATLIDADGEAVLPQGPPTLGFSWSGSDGSGGIRVRDGRPPAAPDEMAIDVTTADANGFEIGDDVSVIFPKERATFTVVGLIGFGRADNLAGATMAVFDLPTAQRYLDKVGKVDAIYVESERGVADEDVLAGVQEVIPDNAEALLGTEAAASDTADIAEFVDIIQAVLLGFAAMAMFVAIFIIYNTFSIVVAQRIREFALLRAIGATRRQVASAIMVEATFVGLVASAVGIAAGIGLARLLRWFIETFGGSIPQTDLVLETRTVVVSLIVGVSVTVISAIVPAIRGTRVPPVAALRIDAIRGPSRRAAFWRIALGTLLLASAVLAGAVGIASDDGETGAALVGLGAALTVVGAVLAGPVAVRPLVWLLARTVLVPFGTAGRLAAANASRAPQRTVATASALTIGVAVVVLTVALSGALDRTIRAEVGDTIRADVIVGQFSGPPTGFSQQVYETIKDVPEVEVVTRSRYNLLKLEDDAGTTDVVAIEPSLIEEVRDVNMVDGAVEDLVPGSLIVSEGIAETHNLEVGEDVNVRFPSGKGRTFAVAGVYAASTGDVPLVMTLDDYQRSFQEQLDLQVMVTAADGVSADELRDLVAQAVDEDFPVVEVETAAGLRDVFAEQVDQLLLMMLALLGLSVIIAFLGIVNTLGLSVVERTREIGLARAVGMTRGQVRNSIALEAVTVSLYGALVGIAIGLAAGWALVEALSDEGIVGAGFPEGIVLGFPGGVIVEVVIAAVAAGMASAVIPAWRAARMNVLEAISRN